MAKTIEQLKAQSAEVKNASVIGENTATRVGSLFNDIVEHVEAYEAGQAQKDTEQSTSINKETARAMAAETTLSERINQEVTDRKAMDETIGIQLDNEINRAKEMEQKIADNLSEHIGDADSKFGLINETLVSQGEADGIHDSRILELEKAQWPLMLTLDITPLLLEYTGTSQTLSAKYTVKHKGVLKLPKTLSLTQDDEVITTDPANEDIASISVNKLGDTIIRLSATAHSYYDYHSDKTDDIISATISKTIQMVLPVYAGFGTSADSVKTSANKLSVRTSAAGTYSKTCQADGQNFYILVPRTFATLTSFTMGGAPFVMETSDITLGGYEYKQYKSGSVYNTGATVNIKAS